MPGVILPFPGGVASSGSKAGSKYKFAIASTYAEYLPDAARQGRTSTSRLPEGVASVQEIIINGADLPTIVDGDAGRDRGREERPGLADDLGGQLRRATRQELHLPPPGEAAAVGGREQGRQGRQLSGVGSWRPWCRNLDSKGAKGANFWGSGVGTLAGQKLYSKGAK